MADAFYAALTDMLVRTEITVDELAERTGIHGLHSHLRTHYPKITLNHAYKIGKAFYAAPLVIMEPGVGAEGVVVTDGIEDFLKPQIPQNYNGIALKAMRADQSVSRFAAEINVSLSAYYDLENGSKPSLKGVMDVWRKLGCEVKFLVDYEKLASRIKRQLQISEEYTLPLGAPAASVAQHTTPKISRAAMITAARPKVVPAKYIPEELKESPVPFDLSTIESQLKTFEAFFPNS